MRDCIVIRSHNWSEDEERLVNTLRPAFGENVFAAIHLSDRVLSPTVPIAGFDDEWVRKSGLRVLHDYGWRCGDYAIFAAREAFPDFDRYWLIEPDVAICGDVRAFYAQAAEINADALGVDVEDMSTKQDRFTKGLPAFHPFRATFALTRFSAAALDYLLPERKTYSASGVGSWRFSNDEIFCFSHLMAHPDFSVSSLQDRLPEWFDRHLFSTDPDLLDRFIQSEIGTNNQVCHPVRGLAGFSAALSERLNKNAAGFLKQLRPSLQAMTKEERRRIADESRHLLEDLLHDLSK